MERAGFAFLLLVSVIVLLAGCTGGWSEPSSTEGWVSLRVIRADAWTSDADPRVIPPTATKIRVRIWHPETGINVVATAALSDSTANFNIALPEDDGYVVDVVSYVIVEGRATALTGGRAPEVAIHAKVKTDVSVTLRPWTTETGGDTQVGPGDSFVVRFVPTDADGLITRQTFESATLHTSTTSFQAASAALPTTPASPGIVLDDQMSFTGTAPMVSAITTLHMAALVRFTSGWQDSVQSAPSERALYIELPNRHMGEPLRRLVVDPTSGGLVIDVSSAG